MRMSTGLKMRICLLAGISAFLLILSATAATAGSISGVVFNDLNQNGAMDAGEPGLQGWTVTATALSTSISTTAPTDANGYYTFIDLPSDFYTVAENPTTGWNQTTPQDPRYNAYPEFQNVYFIDIYNYPTATDVNFGNYQSGGGGGGGNVVNGKMTGSGSVDTVKLDFELNCNVDKKSNNLEVNWGKNKFHLESLTSASCSDDPAINPAKPSAAFDTYTGEGTGRYNKISGYTASWTFKDAGEPGMEDTVSILIKDPIGNTVLEVKDTKLKDGNIQVHNK